MRKRRVIRAFKVNQTKTGEDKFKRSLYKGRMYYFTFFFLFYLLTCFTMNRCA